MISHHGFCNFHPLFYMYMYKMCMETTKENLSAFHSTKKSGLNFGNFQERVEQYFPKFPKRAQPREVYPNSGKLFPGSFLSIQLSFRNFINFRLSCSHFATVSGIFLGNFCTICCCFQIFETVGSLNGKRPLYIDIKQ